MDQSQGSDVDVVNGGRRFQSPLRVLARLFLLSRDAWKQKHHQVQAKLENRNGSSRRSVVIRGIVGVSGARRSSCSRSGGWNCSRCGGRRLRSRLDSRKRVISGGDSEDRISEEAIPKGGSTPIGVIDVTRRPVMKAGVALRAIPRVLELFTSPTDPSASIPSASGARWWWQRRGLFARQEPLEVGDDWCHLIDHSVQIGSATVCVIPGLRLSELPSPARPLRHEDVRSPAPIPTEKSNGQVVHAPLEQAALRTGIPRQIVSDHGCDVKKGSELFAARHVPTPVVCDAAHYGASRLKRRLEADARRSI